MSLGKRLMSRGKHRPSALHAISGPGNASHDERPSSSPGSHAGRAPAPPVGYRPDPPAGMGHGLATTPPPWGRFGSSSVEPPSGSLPIVNLAADRIASINSDTPALFEIRREQARDPGPAWYEIPAFGQAAVRKHKDVVQSGSDRIGIDPDVARAIMHTENARGHYGHLTDFFQERLPGSLRDEAKGWDWRLNLRPESPELQSLTNWLDRKLDRAKAAATDPSVLPMNIRAGIWGPLGLDSDNVSEPTANIRAGLELLRRIADRTPGAGPAEIGSVWNSAGREQHNDFGAAVERAYREKPWLEAPSSAARHARAPGRGPRYGPEGRQSWDPFR